MEQIVTDMRDVLQCSQMAVVHLLCRNINNGSVCPDETVVSDIMDQNEALLDSIFENVRTAKQLKAYCIRNLGLVQPIEIVLGSCKVNGKLIKHSFQYVPLLTTLQNYIEHYDVAAEVIADSLQPPDNNFLRSYKDGSAFKQSPLFSAEGIVIRLHLYVDDFEVCNPIGSRRGVHKLTAVYFVIGNIPTKFWSQTDNIHLCLLARTKCVKLYGLDKIMDPLIADVKKLESEGVTIKLHEDETKCRGSIATISADNLASHQIGGFRETFSSGKVCRYCLVDYSSLADHTTEENCVIRTPEVHENHVRAVQSDKRLVKTYGVKGCSVFDSISNFSTTECLPADVMHDVLESLCPINVRIVLCCLIKDGKLTTKTFNDRLDMFVFSRCDSAAKPPHISDDFLTKGRLSGSASQNWCLFRNLPFLVYDCLDVSVDGEFPEYWQLHLLARQICSIVFAPEIQREWLLDLQSYICQHHALLKKLDSSAFTPKLHFLIHYPRLFELYGPLRHLWCMRFEACHQYYKRVARINNNYKNIAASLSERHQLKVCYLMSGDRALPQDVVILGVQSTVTVAALCRPLQQVLLSTFSLEPSAKVLSMKAVRLQCATVYVNELYVIDVTADYDIPIFMQVTNIIENVGTCIICGLLCVAAHYDAITDSYVVDCCDEYVAVTGSELLSYKPILQVQVDGKRHVSLSYRVCNRDSRV